MKKLRVRAWISESDYQVVKGVAQVIDDVTFGWGLALRLHTGTVAEMERTKINNEVWLPARMEIKGSGRALLRRFSVSSLTVYSDYKKFNVSTDQALTPQ